MAADGHTYERSGIAQWLANNNTTSPVTRAVLRNQELLSNHQLKQPDGSFLRRIRKGRCEAQEAQRSPVQHSFGSRADQAGQLKRIRLML